MTVACKISRLVVFLAKKSVYLVSYFFDFMNLFKESKSIEKKSLC